MGFLKQMYQLYATDGRQFEKYEENHWRYGSRVPTLLGVECYIGGYIEHLQITEFVASWTYVSK